MVVTKPYIYDTPKNDFIPHCIISLQMNVIFQDDYFVLWLLLFNLKILSYFKFIIILKLYNKTATMPHYFIGTSQYFNKVFCQVFSPNLGDQKQAWDEFCVSETTCAIRGVLLIQMYLKSTLQFLNDSSKTKQWNYWNKFVVSKETTLKGKILFQICLKNRLIKLLSIP